MTDFLLPLPLLDAWHPEDEVVAEETDAAHEDDTDTEDGDADGRGRAAGLATGFAFVGEFRGDSDGDEDLLENEDEDEEDEEERDETLLLPSRTDWLRRMARSLRPMGAALVSNSSDRATARRGAGIMDWTRGGGCSGGGDGPPFIVTLTLIPDGAFLTFALLP